MLTVLRTETLEGVGVLGIPRAGLSRQESGLAFIEIHVSDTRLVSVPGQTGVFEEGVGELGIHSAVIRGIIYFNFVFVNIV